VSRDSRGDVPRFERSCVEIQWNELRQNRGNASSRQSEDAIPVALIGNGGQVPDDPGQESGEGLMAVFTAREPRPWSGAREGNRAGGNAFRALRQLEPHALAHAASKGAGKVVPGNDAGKTQSGTIGDAHPPAEELGRGGGEECA